MKKRNIITGTLDLFYSSLQVDDLCFGVSVGSPDVFAQSPAVASCPGDVGFEFHVVSAGNVEGSGDLFLQKTTAFGDGVFYLNLKLLCSLCAHVGGVLSEVLFHLSQYGFKFVFGISNCLLY